MAHWSAECSSDSESENFFQALGAQYKSKDLVQVLSHVRGKESKLECIKGIRRKKLNEKVNVSSEPSKQEQDVGASDTTLSEMRSPLSSGGRELLHSYQQQRRDLSAFDYDDNFPALTGKSHTATPKTSSAAVKKKKVVAQLDRVMSNYARHKLLEEQQIKLSEQEALQQRLQTPVQPVVKTTKSTIQPTDLSFDSDSDGDSPDSGHGLMENSLQSKIKKVGKLLEDDGLT